jgi:carboxymethylenebutenolidase
VRDFYARYFIGRTPQGIRLELLSRTADADRVVDEMLISFTHDIEMPWMLPGIAPTGRRVEIAVVAVIGFRDGKVDSEHIYWDQASVLVQIGKLDPEGLPIAGAGTARKAVDKTLSSNALMRDLWRRSAGKPI